MLIYMIKVFILVLYFAVIIGIGFYCRKNATDVNGFVLGGRAVGPWLTAFAYGTSYFSAVVFVGYAGQFGWKYGFCNLGRNRKCHYRFVACLGSIGKKNKDNESAS